MRDLIEVAPPPNNRLQPARLSLPLINLVWLWLACVVASAGG